MGTKARLKWYILYALVFIIAVPRILNRVTCANDAHVVDFVLDHASEADRKKIIDFVLDDTEGMFRRSCHKANVIEYIQNSIDHGKSVDFNKLNLIPYIGMHAAKKYTIMNYEEPIRAMSVHLAIGLKDDIFFKKMVDFYKNDKDSQLYVVGVVTGKSPFADER